MTTQGDSKHESEELDEAVSQTGDCSDEELTEHSVSPKIKSSNGPISRDTGGAQGLGDTGEARGAHGKRREDPEDDYDIEGEDDEEAHVDHQDCDVEEEDSMMLGECP